MTGTNSKTQLLRGRWAKNLTAAVANAASSYVAAYANGYDAETRAALNDAGTELSADLSAETTLDGALWDAQGTAFSGYLNAIRSADSTSNILSYVTSAVGASITYASSLANAYGDFQIANRQNKLNATTLSNPRRAAYQVDVVWAQQTKSLRNQYYSASGSVLSDYYASVNAAIATYNAAALDAELTAAQSYFNAERTFSQNVSETNSDYVLANFNAAKARALAYLTASVAELTANYAAEAQLAAERADAYAAALEDLLAELAAADLTKFETLSTLKENFEDALTEANAADATLAALNEAELASEKAQNAATASAAKTSADTTYNNAWRSAWNDAFLAALAKSADLAASYDSINAALETALNAASLAYRDAAFGAWEDFLDDALELDNIYAHNQERINQGGTVANNVFENPTFDYEVCFVAGTQVLMADGSTKPIEQIRPGDQVLAADHLNPEEKPAAANVVRFFDNGEKDVVKLIFSGRDAEPEEIVCTPEHRFYVIDRGWICAKDLQLGDCCLSANGERIAFLSRETLEEKQRVYNFEIQEKHTYYVNFIDKSSILVHNECSASDLKGLSPEVFEFYRQLFGKKGLLLLNGYLSGGNIIEAKDFWFASTKSSDGYWTGGLFNPTYNNHYRIQIDPDINPLESSLLLYEEVLKSRTSVYVYKYLDSTYLTEEFVKNRLGQLETLKAITHEAGDNLELLVSIANEPADWILSFNEFLDTGDVKPLLISGLPLVSGVMLKKIMGKLDFLRKVNIEYGCEEVAERVLKALDSIGIKGEVVKINIKPGISRIPGHTPTLGSVAGKTRMWTYHIVVIDRNMQMVYDVLTGPSGMKFDEYKKLFDNADIIDWKF